MGWGKKEWKIQLRDGMGEVRELWEAEWEIELGKVKEDNER